MPESRRRIIDSHERGNTERGRVVRDELSQAVAAAELVHNGTVIAIGGVRRRTGCTARCRW